MRMSELLQRTEKQTSLQVELPSYRLLLRAGLVQRLAAGIYSLTPLARRAMRRVESIVREEMERIGGQEVLLPLVQPAKLWQESGRYQKIGDELIRFDDRGGRPMVLAMTHEEAATDLIRAVAKSYQQLPRFLFQIQTKFRDEARPRGGLVRLREFLMKDAYSFHATRDDLDAFYERAARAYQAIFQRLDLPVLVVEADTGMMGGWESHEFILLAEGGEDTLLLCPSCGYAANAEIAAFRKSTADGGQAATPRVIGSLDIAELSTPGATTIAALCEATGCRADQTLKAVFYTTDTQAEPAGDLVLALIRGDLEVNELKLRTLLGGEVRTLTSKEVAEHGLVAGYAGPVNLRVRGSVRLVADDSVVTAGPLISGANRRDYHLSGVTYGRDYVAALTGDIAQAREGHGCPNCGETLVARRGIEVGHTFKLGTTYSTAMDATFVAEDGTGNHPVIMASYGIGISRLLACVIEQHHDQDGIIWPVSVAPYAHHLLVAGNDAAARARAELLYLELGENATLYDDRDLSAGVKLKDADLLGMPVRITISKRSLAAGGVELRSRSSGKTIVVTYEEVKQAANELLATCDMDRFA